MACYVHAYTGRQLSVVSFRRVHRRQLYEAKRLWGRGAIPVSRPTESLCPFSRSYCYTVWSAIGIILLSVCLSVTLRIVALRVGVHG